MIQLRLVCLGETKAELLFKRNGKAKSLLNIALIFLSFYKYCNKGRALFCCTKQKRHICEICGSFCEKREKTIRFWEKELLHCKAVINDK